MRHSASMVAAMEGASRTVFRIARELAQNSRAGLTTRFLSKKLDVPEEEIEYLVDINHGLLYTDITRIRLAPEGISAVKRIVEGLENRGDIPSLFNRARSLSDHDFRRIEEGLELDRPTAKKALIEEFVQRVYAHPDSVVEYVASRGFSPMAREVFDIVWQSKGGVMPVASIRAAHGGPEYDVEQALWELFRGLALFEMFRFDAEDRLVRVAGVLTEIRQWRESSTRHGRKTKGLKGQRALSGPSEQRELRLTDSVCQLVAALAARPARLRGDGELFREDRRRLSEIVSEDAVPSLATCLWAAEGVGWAARVDNELRAGELKTLVEVAPFERHRLLFDWMMSMGEEAESRRTLANALDELKAGTWYRVTDFIEYALQAKAESEQPVLKSMGGHYAYVSPGTASSADKTLARSLEETLFWLGVVERAEDGGGPHFRVTDLGRCLLTGRGRAEIEKRYAKRSAEIVVQPNFDIVVPTQDMDPLLTVPLDQFAVRQSTGRATVYHLNKESFTQALQEGHDGEAFVEFLAAHNRGGALPANVMMTLDDWRGGLRRVRLRNVPVLETDDALVLADLMHRRKFRKYLQPVDPQRMVTYGKISRAEFAKQLEKDGFIVE